MRLGVGLCVVYLMGYFNLKTSTCVFFRLKTFISVVYLLNLFSLFSLSGPPLSWIL